MKDVTMYNKKIQIGYLRVAIFVILLGILCFPNLMFYYSDGDNFYGLFINGELMGEDTDPTVFDQYIVDSRRNLAKNSSDLLFVDMDIEIQSREVVLGRVSRAEEVIANISNSMQESIKETLKQCYTVKIGEIVLNLSSQEEVKQLLQAAINKYDKSNTYHVELVNNAEREFSALTSYITSKEKESDVIVDFEQGAGIHTMLIEMFEQVEPAKEKTFADYDQGIVDMGFSENIEVVEAYLDVSQLTDIESAIADITQDKEENVVYEVIQGDTLSEIAIKVNIPIDDIVAMNSATLTGVNSTLRIGQELIVTVPKAKLEVKWSEIIYVEEEYEEEIIYVPNDDWYTTDMVTLQEPSAGFRKAIVELCYVNDDQVEKIVIQEEVVMEAVPKIVERGTKIPPSYIKPFAGGMLSSYFGYRTAPIAGASTYHQGVDWATPTGTSIYASSGGTVTQAGWLGGYGYVVYIKHADGKETRYAHLSRVLVSVGQSVSQGQQIALSGNTGNSSGPHLHFEIRINGTAVNPLSIIQ